MTPQADEQDQAPVAEFLARAETRGGEAVDQIETHISRLYLAGDRVLKLKRAVHLPYADFSTVEKRRQACEEEVRINRRTATDLYEACVPVTRDDSGSLGLDGGGTPVDWVTVMRRFPQDQLFDRMALAGDLTPELLEETGRVVAEFHDTTAETGGTARPFDEVVEGVAEELRAQTGILPERDATELADRLRTAAREQQSLLEERRDEGLVRDGHGDLHLGNIVLLDGIPTPFDAIEFNPALRQVDLLYDAAFLVMDLLHRGLAAAANRFLGAWLHYRQDYSGLALLPLFLATRAAIRAHVVARQAAGRNADEGNAGEAKSFLALALDCLDPAPARLVAIGGYSGTGKTTLARALAPAIGPPPGAIILRSDEIRKQMAGADTEEKLAQRWYRPAVSRKVFTELAGRARQLLGGGHAAIADGVYGDAPKREEIRSVAADAGVDFTGLWLAANTETRVRRVRGRRGDASDATPKIARQQQGPPPAEDDWITVDAGGGPERTAAAARTALDDALD